LNEVDKAIVDSYMNDVKVADMELQMAQKLLQRKINEFITTYQVPKEYAKFEMTTGEFLKVDSKKE